MVWRLLEVLFACLLAFFSFRIFKNKKMDNKTRFGIGYLSAIASTLMVCGIILQVVVK